jgi:hypothetical protein
MATAYLSSTLEGDDSLLEGDYMLFGGSVMIFLVGRRLHPAPAYKIESTIAVPPDNASLF